VAGVAELLEELPFPGSINCTVRGLRSPVLSGGLETEDRRRCDAGEDGPRQQQSDAS